MEKLVTKSENIGYRYDEGERPDFDAYISRLAEFGLPKSYLYESIYEAKKYTDEFDYDAFDKERVARLGYPIDWLRRCGFTPLNMSFLPDEKIIDVCESLKAFDETASRCKIMFEGKKDQMIGLVRQFLENN
jgi:hypothetical protein